jgi:hypothetical protein
MKRNLFVVIISATTIAMLLSACGGRPAATATEAPFAATPSLTPDPCAPGQIEAIVKKVNNHMREFDDASMLASNLQAEQLGSAITDLQRIRREAEDESSPACLTSLKTYQIDHMNSVINTLTAFMNGADQQTVNQGIDIARQQHQQYTLELIHVLGLTVVPATPARDNLPTATPMP